MNIFTKGKAVSMAIMAAVLAYGCAKESSTDTSEMEQAYFNAWINVNHPEARSAGLGVYIIDDQPGTGSEITDDDLFIFAEYTATDLNGNVNSTTLEKLSQQVGSFSAANYYGADVVINNRYYTETGVLEMIKGMRVGGTRTAVIPSWLNATADYDTVEEYMKNNSGTNAIYTIKIVDKADDIVTWQIDTLERYVAHKMEAVDSVMFGYYYKTLKEPTDTNTFSQDTSFYINYTGRLLNGHVFDTTVEDTAKVYGLWSSSKTYSPMLVTMAEEYTDITIGTSSSSDGSTTVPGFSYCLSRLRPFEKGVCAFYSALGYGLDGSGSAIPKFAPITFEIEVVAKPND